MRELYCFWNKWFFGIWTSCYLLIEPRDMWIGVYWKRYPKALELYICFIPIIPFRLYFQWN